MGAESVKHMGMLDADDGADDGADAGADDRADDLADHVADDGAGPSGRQGSHPDAGWTPFEVLTHSL